jgi:hypothetical protein
MRLIPPERVTLRGAQGDCLVNGLYCTFLPFVASMVWYACPSESMYAANGECFSDQAMRMDFPICQTFHRGTIGPRARNVRHPRAIGEFL